MSARPSPQTTPLHPLVASLLDGAAPGFDAIHDALVGALPMLADLADTPQDPGWHAEGDVHVHTRMVVDALYALLETQGAHLTGWSRAALVLATALHDIAKPITTTRREIRGVERIVAPRHAMRGRDYLGPRLAALGLPREVQLDVMALVGHHHDPKQLVLAEQRGTAKPWLGYRKLARLVDLERVRLLELADMRGRRCDDRAEQIELIELFGLMAQEHGALDPEGRPVDVYADTRTFIDDALADCTPARRALTFATAVRDLEAGVIATSDEAVARAWGTRHDPVPELVLTVGASGSGKSAFVERLERDEGFEVVSLDRLRGELASSIDDQRHNGRVLAASRELLREHLRAGRRIVYDATSLRRDLRRPVVGLGMDYGALVTEVVFLVGPATLVSRNAARARSVPRDVLDRQLDRFEIPTADEVHRLEWRDATDAA